MKNPYVGTDHQYYERDEISQWLQAKPASPATCESMQMHYIMQDRTIKIYIINE